MSANARILEHGSRNPITGKPDTRRLFYRTLIVHTPDIADVVKDINYLRILADQEDDRLAPSLYAMVEGFDNAIASLSSVKGKMWDKLTTNTQSYTVKDNNTKQKAGLSEILGGQPQAAE